MRQASEEFFPRTVQRQSLVVAFWNSTVGKKIVMAVTGAIGVGYLIGHVAGNLLVFQGPAKIDAYAAFLKSNPTLLWTTRAILIFAVVLHIIAAFQLARISQKSRPVAYKRWRAVRSERSWLIYIMAPGACFSHWALIIQSTTAWFARSQRS